MRRGRQIIRQWKLLQLLSGLRHGMTVAELHEALDEPCAERTLRRDLEALSQAGFPLVDIDGRWRCLTSSEGAWSLPIEPSEMVALMLAEDAFERLPLADSLRVLRGRMEAMLSPKARAFCAQLREHLRSTTFASVVFDDHARVLDELQTAIRQRRLVRLGYRSPRSGASVRTIEPHLLWHAAGGVYVVAWDHRAEDIRTFAVHRIEELEVLATTFEPDPTFDPAAFTRLGFGVFHDHVHRVVVEFRDDVAYWVRERLWHPSQRLTETEWGVKACWTMSGLPEIARWLAGFGGAVSVIAPRALAAEVRALHREGLAAADAPRGGDEPEPVEADATRGPWTSEV